MPNNDRDVFEYLQSDPDTDVAQDFLAYAVFASEKAEWIELWTANHAGNAPSQFEIDD